MTLSFAGIPLLYDYQNAAQSFLDQFQKLEDLLPELRSAALDNWQVHSKTHLDGTQKGIGLPRYNWPARPPLRINQLYWPTGASRFSYGLFLIDRAGLTLLAARGCEKAGSLIASHPARPATVPDADGDLSLTTTFQELYYLTPKRIAGCDNISDLWLLPLVDRRYWWQFADTEDLKAVLQEPNDYCQTVPKATWNDLLEHLATQITEPFVAHNIPAAYGVPDCQELYRQHYNLPVFMDAVAASIGRRIVANLDGTISFQHATGADVILTENLSRLNAEVAGTLCLSKGQLHLPQKVRTAFLVSYCHHLSCHGDRYTVDETIASNCSKIGYIKTIHSSAVAAYPCDCEDDLGDPDNKTELDALAQQITTDWRDWHSYAYDFTYSAPQRWNPSGFDDHILWSFGREVFDCYQPVTSYMTGRSGEAREPEVFLENTYRREHQTRIQSWPLTCDVDSMFHHVTQAPESPSDDALSGMLLPDKVLVKFTGEWAPDDCCEDPSSSGEPMDGSTDGRLMFNTAQVYRYCDCRYVEDPSYEIKVYDALRTLCPEEEEEGGSESDEEETCEFAWAHWNCEDNRWHIEPTQIATTGGRQLEELCAKETAERNVPYQCELFVWNPTTARWCPGGGDVWAIDHRYGAPHAEAGWKGLYQRMPYSGNLSSSSGDDAIDEIWVCVSLDCELPPEGCACDEDEPVVPAVETLAATSVSYETATINAQLNATEEHTCRIEWREKGVGAPWSDQMPTARTGPVTFSENLTSLTFATTYEFRAHAVSGGVDYYGDVLEFETLPEP